jgi:hypothetical protein
MRIIKTVEIFDFDGTLFRTPTKEEGSIVWESKTGKPWIKSGWWGLGETLDVNIFDIQPIEHVKDALLVSAADLNTHTSLVTGRHKGIQRSVMNVLKTNNLDIFDSYFFANGKTLEFKLNVFNQLCKLLNPTNFIIWEDRVEHIPHFKEWGENKFGDNFVLNEVKS